MTLAVQGTCPPNAPVSTYFASASSTVQAKSGAISQEPVPIREHITLRGKSCHSRQEPERSTRSHEPVPPRNIPPEPRAREEHQKPRSSASAVFRQSPYLRTTWPSNPFNSYQDKDQTPRVQSRRYHQTTGVKPDKGNYSHPAPA